MTPYFTFLMVKWNNSNYPIEVVVKNKCDNTCKELNTMPDT